MEGQTSEERTSRAMACAGRLRATAGGGHVRLRGRRVAMTTTLGALRLGERLPQTPRPLRLTHHIGASTARTWSSLWGRASTAHARCWMWRRGSTARAQCCLRGRAPNAPSTALVPTERPHQPGPSCEPANQTTTGTTLRALMFPRAVRLLPTKRVRHGVVVVVVAGGDVVVAAGAGWRQSNKNRSSGMLANTQACKTWSSSANTNNNFCIKR
jgi:hypothetical protein